MFLKSLHLQSFRSFKKKSFKFSPKTTLIIGPNAVGKTNILEAIYLLAIGKSFRASREQELIKYDQEVAWAAGAILDGKMSNTETLNFADPESAEKIKLEIILTNGEVQGKKTGRKLYKVNGVGKRWRNFAGILKCVLFRPEDIDLILGSPSIRRNYLDSVLEQADWQYRVCNLAYKKGLRQRNKLLDRIREGPSFAKASEGKQSQLTFWNQLLIKNGQIITQKREELIDFYNQEFKEENHDNLSHKRKFVNKGVNDKGVNDIDNNLNLEIYYDKSMISQKRLEKYAQAELALGRTLVGPHRDDIIITSTKRKAPNNKQGRKLALYGSRGEQRMAVLYLKLAELGFMSQKTRQQPVLLLDDIFSELDKEHRQLVLKIINKSQTIITSTEREKDLFSFISLSVDATHQVLQAGEVTVLVLGNKRPGLLVVNQSKTGEKTKDV